METAHRPRLCKTALWDRVGRLEAELARQRAMTLAVSERLYTVSRHLSVLVERKGKRRAK